MTLLRNVQKYPDVCKGSSIKTVHDVIDVFNRGDAIVSGATQVTQHFLNEVTNL